MRRLIRLSVTAVLLAVMPAAAQAPAENEGQADLDRATEVTLSAQTVNDLSEAIRLLHSALEKGLDADNSRFANSLLASTLTQRGSVAARLILQSTTGNPKVVELRRDALADLEEGVKLNPRQPEALYEIAQLNLLPGGSAKRAIEALGQAIDLSAEEPQLRIKALMLRAAIEEDAKKKLADLDEAVRIAPDDSTVWRARGSLRADLGNLEEALADLNKAIELTPEHTRTYEAKAIVLARLERYDEALVSLDKAQELSPDSVLPLVQKAQIYGRQMNFDAALHELSRALSMDPKNAAVLLLRAGAYRDKGELEKALADADAALKLTPRLAGGMRLRAVLLAEGGKRDEAIAQLEALRRLDPKDLLGLLQLGTLYVAADKYEQAVEVYSAVLADHPEERIALRGRGDALLNVGRHRQAIADYEALIKLEPKDAGTLNNLAWVLATSPEEKLRDGKRALALATEACELTEYHAAHILSTLGAACAETGDFETAIKWVQKGLEIADKDEKEALGKELEGYRTGKPFRELLSIEKPEEPKPDEPTPRQPNESPDRRPDQ